MLPFLSQIFSPTYIKAELSTLKGVLPYITKHTYVHTYTYIHTYIPVLRIDSYFYKNQRYFFFPVSMQCLIVILTCMKLTSYILLIICSRLNLFISLRLSIILIANFTLQHLHSHKEKGKEQKNKFYQCRTSKVL